MENKILQSIFAGVGGVIIMLLFMEAMFIASGYIFNINTTNINAAGILLGILSLPVLLTWVINFVAGILFAFTYNYFFKDILDKLKNDYTEGVIFGIFLFIITMAIVYLINITIKPVVYPEGTFAVFIVINLVSHIFFGITVAKFEDKLSG